MIKGTENINFKRMVAEIIENQIDLLEHISNQIEEQLQEISDKDLYFTKKTLSDNVINDLYEIINKLKNKIDS